MAVNDDDDLWGDLDSFWNDEPVIETPEETQEVLSSADLAELNSFWNDTPDNFISAGTPEVDIDEGPSVPKAEPVAEEPKDVIDYIKEGAAWSTVGLVFGAPVTVAGFVYNTIGTAVTSFTADIIDKGIGKLDTALNEIDIYKDTSEMFSNALNALDTAVDTGVDYVQSEIEAGVAKGVDSFEFDVSDNVNQFSGGESMDYHAVAPQSNMKGSSDMGFRDSFKQAVKAGVQATVASKVLGGIGGFGGGLSGGSVADSILGTKGAPRGQERGVQGSAGYEDLTTQQSESIQSLDSGTRNLLAQQAKGRLNTSQNMALINKMAQDALDPSLPGNVRRMAQRTADMEMTKMGTSMGSTMNTMFQIARINATAEAEDKARINQQNIMNRAIEARQKEAQLGLQSAQILKGAAQARSGTNKSKGWKVGGGGSAGFFNPLDRTSKKSTIE